MSLAAVLSVMLTFDPSVSPDVVSYEANVWERRMVEVVCSGGGRPCIAMTAPGLQSWAIVPAGGERLALWAPALDAGSVQMFQLRAVDAAGNRSAEATDWKVP